MHVIDTLEAGGAEQVAVNLANLLPRAHYAAHLCTTRGEGVLDATVAADVGRLRLARRRRFDAAALRRMVAYIRAHDIKILHAHGSSVFIAGAASLFARRSALIWHDHYGLPLNERAAWIERPVAKRADGVIAVSEPLAEWSRRKLSIEAERVWYIPNFTCAPPHVNGTPTPPELPGVAGARIVCVANLRPQKDHLTLVRAMAGVVRQVSAAHLLIVGAAVDAGYEASIKSEIESLGLGGHVSLLGQRRDVANILRACDVGVLSSMAEGLPLALIEYAQAGLATVATRVGQCAEVLDNGRAGLLASPGDPEALSGALIRLLDSPVRRTNYGRLFKQRSERLYNAGSIVERVCGVYDAVLASRTGRG